MQRGGQEQDLFTLSLVPRRANGFTLLEVLLAMAMLVVIMTPVYMSFSTAGRNVKEAETLRDDTDLARALIARLSTDIANAYCMAGPVPMIFYGTKEAPLDQLTAGGEGVRRDSLSLTTLTNWRRPDSPETELWEVGYFFREKPEGAGYTLFRREKRQLSPTVPALEGGDEFEITDRVQSLRFSYSDDGVTWTDNGWDSRKMGSRAPKVVEIACALVSGRVFITRVDVGNRL